MSAPGYWMHETTGVLRPAVERYLRREPLSPANVATLRAYLRQWIFSPAWDMNPHGTDSLHALRDLIDSLNSRAQIDHFSERAIEAGLDPW